MKILLPRSAASLGVVCTIAVLAVGAPLDVHAQTTTMQRPDGSTATMTVQSGGGAGALTVVQGPPGGVIGSAITNPQPPRDQSAVQAVGTARIAGRVTAADSGRPLRRALVRMTASGRPDNRTAITDQDGAYEFTEVAAGAYLISASKPGYVQHSYKQLRPNSPPRPLVIADRENADRIDFALSPGAVITGRVVDEFGEPVQDVMVNARRLQYVNGVRRPMNAGPGSMSNDIGEFRIASLAPGEYYVAAVPRGSVNPFESTNARSGYAPTYFPSTADIASAQRLSLRAGESASNIVVSLTPTRVARVSGLVLDAQGRPASGGAVMVSPDGGIGMPLGNGIVRQDGTFVINGIPPGDYLLRSAPFGPPVGGGPPPAPAMASITVNGSDLENVVLAPARLVTVTGRVTGNPVTLAGIARGTLRFALAPAAGTSPAFLGPTPPAQPVRDDMTFELSTYPGTFVVRPIALTGLVIRSVRANGLDAMKGFAIDATAAVTDLEVEVTDETGKVVVAVTNARGEPAPDQSIVVFPQEQDAWGALLPGRIGTGSTNEQGVYQSPALLAGSYSVAVTEPLEPGQSSDPAFLESIRDGAQPVVVSAGGTQSVSLRISAR